MDSSEMSNDIWAGGIGKEHIIDKETAEGWSDIIGKPLSKVIKDGLGESRNLVVKSVDAETKTITFEVLEDENPQETKAP